MFQSLCNWFNIPSINEDECSLIDQLDIHLMFKKALHYQNIKDNHNACLYYEKAIATHDIDITISYIKFIFTLTDCNANFHKINSLCNSIFHDNRAKCLLAENYLSHIGDSLDMQTYGLGILDDLIIDNFIPAMIVKANYLLKLSDIDSAKQLYKLAYETESDSIKANLIFNYYQSIFVNNQC